MFRKTLFASAICLAAMASARAQSFSSGGGTSYPIPQSASGSIGAKPVGTTSTPVAAAGQRVILWFKNQAALGSIAICPASISAPAFNTPGCVDLAPGATWSPCSASFCPSDAFNAIATGPAVPLTVESN